MSVKRLIAGMARSYNPAFTQPTSLTDANKAPSFRRQPQSHPFSKYAFDFADTMRKAI